MPNKYDKLLNKYNKISNKFKTIKIFLKYMNKNRKIVIDKNNELNKIVEDYKNKLRDCIPLKNQCVICFCYNDKKTCIVPCGHTQHCEDCVKKIKICSLCNGLITQTIKIFT